MQTIEVPPLGWLGRSADLLMIPLMYLVQASLEAPQRTHVWNNLKLRTPEDRAKLDTSRMCKVLGDGSAAAPWLGMVPVFHIPLLGGWRRYVVLEPVSRDVSEWVPGWVSPDVVGVSRLYLKGPVRLLRGPSDALFFGIDQSGRQIELRIVGFGRIGDGGPFARLPLY